MAKYKRGLVTLAALSVLTLAGCAGTAIDSAGDTTSEGLVAGPGFDPDTKTIRIGSLVPVSGVFAGAVTNLQGMEAYFKRATADGGPLEGYTIELENQDTKYDPATAIPLYNGMKDDVALFSMMLGAPIIDALLPSMAEENLVGIPAGIISKFLYDPNLLPTFPLLNAYHAAAVEYAATEMDLADATFCSMIVEDVFGDAMQDAYDFATDELGLDVAVGLRHPSNVEDLTPQITELKSKGCEVVLIGGVGGIVQNFAVKSVQLDFNPTVITSNTAYNITMATGPGADWIKEHAVFAVTGTEWGGDDAPGQVQLEEDLDALGTEIVPTANAFQTGYVNAALAVEVLAKAIANGDVSREGILEVAHSQVDDFDGFGLAGGTYVYGDSVEDRVPPHLMSFFRVSTDNPTGLALEMYNFDSKVFPYYYATL